MKILKGDIIFTNTKEAFTCYEDSYLILEAGKVKEIVKTLPGKYQNEQVMDYSHRLIIPSFVDMHTHAPQWVNEGVGYSKELVPWLNEYTFPLEAEFKDVPLAKVRYKAFINDLWEYGTTRVCIMATRHKEATICLMDLLMQSGLGAFVGKVNMDRNATADLAETTKESIEATKELISRYQDSSDLVKYMVSPRFVPSTTPKLMTALGEIADTYHLPVQSHLCENRDEVKWVKSLHPDIDSFTAVYEHYGLLKQDQTIMAHCVYNTPEERALLKKYGVMVAHCAQSNFNLASGIMPLRTYLNEGIRVGLGSDVGGGHTLDMRQHIINTIQASKMYWVNHPEAKPITMSEAFYLATKSGGSFFGKVGSFEEDYEFDALVVDDSNFLDNGCTKLEERLERFIYAGSTKQIVARYVRGSLVERPF